jgi:hypothetical protein
MYCVLQKAWTLFLFQAQKTWLCVFYKS